MSESSAALEDLEPSNPFAFRKLDDYNRTLYPTTVVTANSRRSYDVFDSVKTL